MTIKPGLLWVAIIIFFISGLILASHTLFTFQQSTILVKWETASEIETVGFNILRSQSPNGDFQKINTALIPVSSDTLSNSTYTFTDTDVKAGKIYYYLLEDIETNGKTNSHGPLKIKASHQKWQEGILACLLFLAGGVCVFLLRDSNENKTNASH